MGSTHQRTPNQTRQWNCISYFEKKSWATIMQSSTGNTTIIRQTCKLRQRVHMTNLRACTPRCHAAGIWAVLHGKRGAAPPQRIFIHACKGHLPPGYLYMHASPALRFLYMHASGRASLAVSFFFRETQYKQTLTNIHSYSYLRIHIHNPTSMSTFESWATRSSLRLMKSSNASRYQ